MLSRLEMPKKDVGKMYEEKSGVYFQIRGINEYENRKRLKVLVRIPMVIGTNMGWIDDVKFVLFDNLENTSRPSEYLLKHKENVGNFAYFENEVELLNNAVYGYCFSFKFEGDFRYVKNKNLTSKDKIIVNECWKMSLNTWSSEWAWLKERIIKNALFINFDIFKSNVNSEKAIFYPEKNGVWYVRCLNQIMSMESFCGSIKTRSVSIIYLNSYEKDWIDVQNKKFIINASLKTLCYIAHKSGMYVILNIILDENNPANISSYVNDFYTLGVDRVDKDSLLSDLVSSKDEILLM